MPVNDFDSWVRDLETVVDTLAAPRVALLGISQGAAIAIAYAARHPQRVSHLVLSGGYARGRLVRSSDPAQHDEAEMMCRLAELGWGKQDPSFRQFFTTQFIPGGSLEQHQWFNELERLSTSPADAARFMREFNRIDVTALLGQVRCPTLVLHSRHERAPAQGRDNAQIAAAMGLSEKTVRNHITGIFDRLEVDNRAQAIVLARESGFGQLRVAVRPDQGPAGSATKPMRFSPARCTSPISSATRP